MLTARLLAFALFEKWGQIGQPFLPAAQQIMGGQGICHLLELARMTAFEKGVGTLLKIDAFRAHRVRQPVVLIEADTC